jgi:hypothetical protein
LATSGEGSLPGMSFALPLLAVAVEEEIRRFKAPAWLGLSALVLRLAWLAGAETGGTSAVLIGLCGAIMITALLLPLYGAGLIRLGTLASGAALGAIWGIDVLPGIVLYALALGVPFALGRIAIGANPRTLPILTAFGLAATLHQFFA